MAFSATLTGTTQNVTATNGSNVLSVTATTGWISGATIQGTGIPAGARVGVIVTNTSVTMVTAAGASAPFTGTTGTVAVLVSSKYGSTVTVSQSGATDYNTPQDIVNAGLGNSLVVTTEPMVHFPGGLTVTWSNIVSGAVFDFGQWGLYFGDLGRWQFDGSTILGELRGGYLVNGTQFLKTAGPTFYCRSWNNGGAGGSNMWTGTATGAMTGIFRMNNLRFVEVQGSNASFYFAAGRMQMIVDNMILDHTGDSAGANASIGAAYGVLNNTSIIKANSGISATNGTNFATFNGLYYAGNYQSSPNHKFSMPDGFVLDGYAPQVLSTQLLGGFSNNTTETYSNINLSTAGWGLNDLKTKYQRYGGPNSLKFPRTVTMSFKDSAAAALTNVTLYIRSGATSLINAVQAGDYSALTQALILTWTTTTGLYRVCDSFTDTISQVAQIRKYGYIEQSTSYSLNLAVYSQPFFMLNDVTLASISESTAAAITTAGINWSTKTITPTADLSFDQINARIAWELAQTTNSSQSDPRTFNGSVMTLATGWSLVVNTGRTISAGSYLSKVVIPTITNNGAITGLYETTTGPSSRLTFSGLVNSSTYVADNTTAQYDYQSNKTGSFVDYFAPGKTGTWSWISTREGYNYQSGTFTPATGGDFTAPTTWVQNTSLIITDPAVLAAYTNLSDVNMQNDYFAYWTTLNAGIPYAAKVYKDGTALNYGNADVYFSNTASVPLAYDLATNKFTVKAVTVGQGSTLFSIKTTGTVTAQSGTTINIAYQDASGLRANIFNLDPEGFNETWYLRYKKNSGGAWTNVSGTGNTSTVLMDVALYDVQVRSPGYDWKTLQIDTAKTQILDAALSYQVSSTNVPQWDMSYDVALANAFQYDSVSMKVAVTNTTSAIIQPGFAELYRATQRIQHLPDLVWTWTNPVTANSSTQKILIPPDNPIHMVLTAASNASVKLTVPVIYSDTGASADDRVLGNSSGYSIILGSPATAESAGLRSEIVSDIIAKIGGTGFTVDTHSLVEVKDFAEKAYKNAKQAKINTF